jgi:hypothetical protein
LSDWWRAATFASSASLIFQRFSNRGIDIFACKKRKRKDNGELIYQGFFSIFEISQNNNMKTELQIDISYEQVLTLVRQLPKQQKIKLSKELEKEGINSKLSELLKTFRTKKLSLETIDKEVEIVRQQAYERKKH